MIILPVMMIMMLMIMILEDDDDDDDDDDNDDAMLVILMMLMKMTMMMMTVMIMKIDMIYCWRDNTTFPVRGRSQKFCDLAASCFPASVIMVLTLTPNAHVVPAVCLSKASQYFFLFSKEARFFDNVHTNCIVILD